MENLLFLGAPILKHITFPSVKMAKNPRCLALIEARWDRVDQFIIIIIIIFFFLNYMYIQ